MQSRPRTRSMETRRRRSRASPQLRVNALSDPMKKPPSAAYRIRCKCTRRDSRADCTAMEINCDFPSYAQATAYLVDLLRRSRVEKLSIRVEDVGILQVLDFLRFLTIRNWTKPFETSDNLPKLVGFVLFGEQFGFFHVTGF